MTKSDAVTMLEKHMMHIEMEYQWAFITGYLYGLYNGGSIDKQTLHDLISEYIFFSKIPVPKQNP